MQSNQVTVLITNYQKYSTSAVNIQVAMQIPVVKNNSSAAGNNLVKHCRVLINLAMQHRGWNVGRGQRTFPILHQTVYIVEHVNTLKLNVLPTRPTQPNIPPGSINAQ